MSEADWGDDFDDEGNVIGDVPDKNRGFFAEHWAAVLVATLAVFALNVPRVAGTGGVGVLVGAAIVSVLVGVPLAYVGVGLRARL